MGRRLFGTDGIRGVANRDPMTPEIAFRVGAAVTYQLRKRQKSPPRIVIGKDTRLSGYLFETALASGICSQGGHVLLSGPVPTPAVAHITRSMRACCGVVISASHNSFEDNGIKLFDRNGFKLPDEQELEIEQLVFGTELEKNRPGGSHVGRAERLDDARGRYIAFVKSTFPNDLTLEGVTLVVDAAHGAAYRVGPSIFEELGAKVHAIGVRPNGRNINARCGALHIEACVHEVLRRGAQLGIALDGDADRLIVVDEHGKVADGDALLALFATRLLAQNRLSQRTLVATVMSNLGLERTLAAHQAQLVRCAVGDRYVVETLRQGGYNLGGEQSGHIIFLDHATTGDGLVAALQLLAIMVREGRSISELTGSIIERVPQTLHCVTLADRRPLEQMARTKRAIEATERVLGADGRVLVRWSGTEPKLRVMIEGPDPERIETMAKEIAAEAVLDTAS